MGCCCTPCRVWEALIPYTHMHLVSSRMSQHSCLSTGCKARERCLSKSGSWCTYLMLFPKLRKIASWQESVMTQEKVTLTTQYAALVALIEGMMLSSAVCPKIALRRMRASVPALRHHSKNNTGGNLSTATKQCSYLSAEHMQLH